VTTTDADHHDYNHEDPHAPEQDDGVVSEYELLSRALQELLEEKGLLTADEVRREMERFEQDFPYRGSRVIARAWLDPTFMDALLEDGKAACEQVEGVDIEAPALIAVANTPTVHNVVVCTLCSCYPRSLLGMPPTWYKSTSYRSRMVREPRAVLREFGTELSDDVELRVHDSTANMRYLVVPMRPEGTEGWNEKQLIDLISRDSLVGVTIPTVTSSPR
jgi:nitrile hydratase alpha subunit